jgi:hypothetical protein
MHGGNAIRAGDRRWVLALTLAAVGCSAALAACGSSSKAGNRSGSSFASGVRFAECMRSHGVPNFPDPSSGGGIRIQAGSGVNPQSPAFKAAQAKCAKLLPRGRPGGPGHTTSEQAEQQMLALSKCMRAHGVSGFPDPTLGPAPLSPQEFSIAMGRGGVSLLVPKAIDVNSPAFKQAAATCHFGALIGAGRRTPAP